MKEEVASQENRELTFKPKINQKSNIMIQERIDRSSSSNRVAAKRLYREAEFREIKKEELRADILKQTCPFKPSLNISQNCKYSCISPKYKKITESRSRSRSAESNITQKCSQKSTKSQNNQNLEKETLFDTFMNGKLSSSPEYYKSTSNTDRMSSSYSIVKKPEFGVKKVDNKDVLIDKENNYNYSNITNSNNKSEMNNFVPYQCTKFQLNCNDINKNEKVKKNEAEKISVNSFIKNETYAKNNAKNNKKAKILEQKKQNKVDVLMKENKENFFEHAKTKKPVNHNQNPNKK